MTDTAPTTPTPAGPTWTRWLYRAFAVTGIAAGIFVIVAGLYLLIAQPGWGGSMKADCKSCCESMKADMEKMMKDMKGMKMPMENMPSMPNMPSMSPMPSMPISPTPSMPMPTPPR
ncbi:hypothetical protein MyChFU_50300 [Mycobacterium intracellulare subsp. chimaera]